MPGFGHAWTKALSVTKWKFVSVNSYNPIMTTLIWFVWIFVFWQQIMANESSASNSSFSGLNNPQYSDAELVLLAVAMAILVLAIVFGK